MKDSQRFRIAISYSGTNRDFVKQVDQALLKYLDHSEVFYDQRYSALMARPDLDGWLRDLFRDRADLIVCFLSKGHDQSPWCQVEANAAREAHQRGDGGPSIMIWKDGDYDLGLGFSMDYAEPIGERTPEEVAAEIIARFKEKNSRVTLKSPEKMGKRLLIEGAIIAGLLFAITSLNLGSGLRDLIPREWLPEGTSTESFYGVFGFIMLIIPVTWGLLRAKHFLRPRDRDVKYSDPPVSAGPVRPSDWEEYAHALEEHYEGERQSLAENLHDMRQRRFILMWSIFLSVALAIGHTMLWLNLKNSDDGSQTFLPQLASSTGGSKNGMWSFQAIIDNHPGHLYLAGFYVFFVSIAAFWVSNRTRRPFVTAGFLGAWQPMYLGIIYVLFISTQNYRGLFETGNDNDTFYCEPGNFYVVERIIIVPLLCWIAALLAGWMGVAARGKSSQVPEA